MKTLRHLSKPGRIGTMITRNRIVMPPMVTKFADENGCVTRQQIDYYRKRAKGGAGYITFEHTSISKQGMLMPSSMKEISLQPLSLQRIAGDVILKRLSNLQIATMQMPG